MYFDKITVGPCTMSNITVTVNHDGTECKGTLPYENVEHAIDLLVNEMEKINDDYEYVVHSLCIPSELEVLSVYDTPGDSCDCNVIYVELCDDTVTDDKFTACGYYIFEGIEIDEVASGGHESEMNTITFDKVKVVLASNINAQKTCN